MVAVVVAKQGKQMIIKKLVTSKEIERWIESHESADSARACLRYALAFNLLDASWVENLLSPFVTYDSQSVHVNGAPDPLRGEKVVFTYWQEKIETLRRSATRRPIFELATTSTGLPCAAGYQPAGDFDQNWLRKPLVNLTLSTDVDGLITRALMITVFPNPATCLRSGIFPGVDDPVKEGPRNFIRSGRDYQGLHFSFFLLNGKTGLDQGMCKTADQTQLNFPGSTYKNIVWEKMSDSDSTELRNAQFVGFPAVAVYYLDECILRFEGLISPDFLKEKVLEVSKLHVVQ